MGDTYNVVGRCMVNQVILDLVLGSALDVKADALVNAANERMEHGGGIASEISNKAGYTLQNESREWISKNGNIIRGGVAVTSAGNLPFKHVIHAVGPQRDSDYYNQDMLVSTIVISLKTAAKLQCKSINIPGISCGIFGFPKDISAKLHFDAFIIFASQADKYSCLKQISLCLFTNEECMIFADEFIKQSDKFSQMDYYGLPTEQGSSIFNSFCTICYKSYNLQYFMYTQNCCSKVCDFCILERSARSCFSCQALINIPQELYNINKCRVCNNLYMKGNSCGNH